MSWKIKAIGNIRGFLSERTDEIRIEPGQAIGMPGEGAILYAENGKFSDSEDSFLYCYQTLDATDSFRMEAILEVLEQFGDQQSGFGILVADSDVSKDLWARHRNLLFLGTYGQEKRCCVRVVSGYDDPDAKRSSINRITDTERMFEAHDQETYRFVLEKNEKGFGAFYEGKEFFLPGHDFLLKQDRQHLHIGIALCRRTKIRIIKTELSVSPGTVKPVPEGTFHNSIRPYPYSMSQITADHPDKEKTVMDVFVSPDGKKHGLGTIDDPLGPEIILDRLAPGSHIRFLDGIYQIRKPLILSSSGTKNDKILIEALHPGRVVIDGSDLCEELPIFILQGSHIVMKGFLFQHGKASGLVVSGSYNRIENCEARGNKDTGIAIIGAADMKPDQWPELNLVIGCDSHDNCDPYRRNADGFAAKLRIGEGNEFRSCIAHDNIDDGFDLYAKSNLPATGAVSLYDCISYRNGDREAFSGCGFKLGGENMPVRHILEDCISYDNAQFGFSSNSNPLSDLYRCNAYGNRKENYYFYSAEICSHRKVQLKEEKISGMPMRNSRGQISFHQGCLYLIMDETNSKNGITDRLKTIVGLYYICKKNDFAFRLIHSAGFDLRDYLLPGKSDWSAELHEIPEDAETISYQPPFDESVHLQKGKTYVCRDYVGKNYLEMTGVKDWQIVWRECFRELFRPSGRVIQTLQEMELPERYLAINARFINSLGHFETSDYNAPLPQEIQEQVIDSVLHKMIECKEQEEQEMIVFSDSIRFLKAARAYGFRTVDPLTVGHIMHFECDEKICLYTFVYFLAMAQADKVYSILHVENIPEKTLYKTQYPRYAAIVGNKPFVRI